MSLLKQVFDRLRGQQQEAEQQRAATLEGVLDVVVRQAKGDTQSAKQLEADAALLERAVLEGLLSVDGLQNLHDQAVMLRQYLETGELPFIDGDAARNEYAKIRDEMNAKLREAGKKIHEADARRSAISESRSAAQRLINQLPLIAEPMIKACKITWSPKIPGKLNDAPQINAAVEDDAEDLSSVASVATSVSDV